MAVPTQLSDLSATAASNSPAGSDSVGSTLDDYLRSHASIIARISAGTDALATPNIGTATATSVNKVAFTQPATGATVTITDGKTLSVAKTLTLTGTDGTTVTFPATSATIARTDAAQTFTGTQTFSGIVATNGQVSFPAAQNASADANTLDDYEEGTFTPSVGGSATYTAQVGKYTKIGNKVTCWFDLHINSIGTGTQGIFTGLPFTANGTVSSSASISYFTGLAASYVFLGGYVSTGSTSLTLTGMTAASAGVTNLASALTSGSRIVGCVTYSV